VLGVFEGVCALLLHNLIFVDLCHLLSARHQVRQGVLLLGRLRFRSKEVYQIMEGIYIKNKLGYLTVRLRRMTEESIMPMWYKT